MLDGFFFPVLPCKQYFLAQVVCHEYGTGFGFPELFRPDLSPVDQGADESVHEIGSEFFHHVQRQSRPARPVTVQKTDGRVQSGGFERATDVMGQQGVTEG